MKPLCALVLLAFLFPLLAQNQAAPTARDYYKELYAAGGLDCTHSTKSSAAIYAILLKLWNAAHC